jgi:hypothetical protein
MLEQVVQQETSGEDFDREVAYTYLSTLLGRTYEETVAISRRFDSDSNVNSLFQITYWLGRLSTEEELEQKDREISFSWALRERLGHHYYGEQWARNIKQFLWDQGLIERPIHLISANLHSVMNCFYAAQAFSAQNRSRPLEDLAKELSLDENSTLRAKVKAYALRNGMYQLDDTSGTNISVQIFDTAQIDVAIFASGISLGCRPYRPGKTGDLCHGLRFWRTGL